MAGTPAGVEICPYCRKPFKRLKSHLPHCKLAGLEASSAFDLGEPFSVNAKISNSVTPKLLNNEKKKGQIKSIGTDNKKEKPDMVRNKAKTKSHSMEPVDVAGSLTHGNLLKSGADVQKQMKRAPKKRLQAEGSIPIVTEEVRADVQPAEKAPSVTKLAKKSPSKQKSSSKTTLSNPTLEPQIQNGKKSSECPSQRAKEASAGQRVPGCLDSSMSELQPAPQGPLARVELVIENHRARVLRNRPQSSVQKVPVGDVTRDNRKTECPPVESSSGGTKVAMTGGQQIVVVTEMDGERILGTQLAKNVWSRERENTVTEVKTTMPDDNSFADKCREITSIAAEVKSMNGDHQLSVKGQAHLQKSPVDHAPESNQSPSSVEAFRERDKMPNKQTEVKSMNGDLQLSVKGQAHLQKSPVDHTPKSNQILSSMEAFREGDKMLNKPTEVKSMNGDHQLSVKGLAHLQKSPVDHTPESNQFLSSMEAFRERDKMPNKPTEVNSMNGDPQLSVKGQAHLQKSAVDHSPESYQSPSSMEAFREGDKMPNKQTEVNSMNGDHQLSVKGQAHLQKSAVDHTPESNQFLSSMEAFRERDKMPNKQTEFNSMNGDHQLSVKGQAHLQKSAVDHTSESNQFPSSMEAFREGDKMPNKHLCYLEKDTASDSGAIMTIGQRLETTLNQPSFHTLETTTARWFLTPDADTQPRSLGLEWFPELYSNYHRLGIFSRRPTQWDTKIPEPHLLILPSENQQVPLAERHLMDVKLQDLPAWLATRNLSPHGVLGAPGRAWNRYYNRYVNVKKGQMAGISMLLLGYCILSYGWRYEHIKEHTRRRKYH